MSKTICLRNGTVFTGIAMVPHASVVIKDGKIADVVSNDKLQKMNLPEDTTMIYVNGATIAPGFIDTHIHGIHGYDTSDATPESILEKSSTLFMRWERRSLSFLIML